MSSPVGTVTMPSASSGRKNPFPSLLPPGIRSSGCGSGRSLFTSMLQPAIDYILRYFRSSNKIC